MSELDEAMDAIATRPLQHAAYHFGCRRYLMRQFPYVIVYRELETHIQVVAVAHGRRNPGYWKDRLGGSRVCATATSLAS